MYVIPYSRYGNTGIYAKTAASYKVQGRSALLENRIFEAKDQVSALISVRGI